MSIAMTGYGDGTNHDWRWDIYINGVLVDTTELQGIAYLKFESAKLLGLAELHRIYQGNAYDPILHRVVIERGGTPPPCPDGPNDCPWHMSAKHNFYITARPTALRIEVLPPQDRCGYLLKPNRIGGVWDDYAICRLHK